MAWLAISLLALESGTTSGICTLPYGTFYQQLQVGQVKNVTLQGDQATGALKQPMACPADVSTKTASFQTTIPTSDQTLLVELDTQAQTTGLSYMVQSSNGGYWMTLLLTIAP